MKFTSVILAFVIANGTCNVMNSLKIADSVKGTVFSAAGKFLNGKTAKTSPAPTNAIVDKSTSKSSRVSQLFDVGTNVAMAVAGAGTLFQALSSDNTPPSPAPTPYLVSKLLL